LSGFIIFFILVVDVLNLIEALVMFWSLALGMIKSIKGLLGSHIFMGFSPSSYM